MRCCGSTKLSRCNQMDAWQVEHLDGSLLTQALVKGVVHCMHASRQMLPVAKPASYTFMHRRDPAAASQLTFRSGTIRGR